jgi:hypothetical protein
LGIKSLLLSRGSPQGYQVVELAFFVLSNLKNQRKHPIPNPTHSAELFGDLRTSVLIVRMNKDLLGFLEANAAIWVLPQSLALAWIEVETHGITVIPYLNEDRFRSAGS